jgi:hypothetical protein
VRLYDREFAHVGTVCGLDVSPNIQWVREGPPLAVNVFTESLIDEIPKCDTGIKVLWLIEPEVIHAWGYRQVRAGLYKDVDYIITFDKSLHDLCPAKAIMWGNGSWVRLCDWGVAPKKKNVSMCASTKANTEFQLLRQEVVAAIGNRLDLVCGTGRKISPPNRVDIFRDYRYSVVIENSCVDWYFSEKILDCFAMGTIPIYCGCPSIERFFNHNGIIKFVNVNDLKNILGGTGPIDYANRLPAVMDNCERAKKYVPVETQLYNSFFKQFDKGGLS